MPISKKYLGIAVRTPSASELIWFRDNQEVAGFASEDQKIVLNPFRRFSQAERNSICINEAYRILMNRLHIVPEIKVTSEQRKFFRGTAYENNEGALKQTIIARISSGDPSAGRATAEQKGYAICLKQFASVWAMK